MTHRERFHRVLNFQPVDRLPVMEWAPWWNQTIDRWHGEGLPAALTDAVAIQEYFGLDLFRQVHLEPLRRGGPKPASHGAGLLADEAGYGRALGEFLYPDPGFDRAELAALAERQRTGELVIWLTFNGFFWFPRVLLGIQRHLVAFYDQPELLHRINADLAAHQLRGLEAILSVCTPDVMTFAEDMSYNHGPMLSPAMFDEFLAPYYHRIIPELKRAGIRVFIDSDGDVTDLLPWVMGAGAEGILPLERMAGVDVSEIRASHPRLLMLGAYDKTVMHRGEAAIRAEFERLLPVMRSGGFIASVDHQTPPGVSLEQYRQYLAIYREYAARAAKGRP